MMPTWSRLRHRSNAGGSHQVLVMILLVSAEQGGADPAILPMDMGGTSEHEIVSYLLRHAVSMVHHQGLSDDMGTIPEKSRHRVTHELTYRVLMSWPLLTSYGWSCFEIERAAVILTANLEHGATVPHGRRSSGGRYPMAFGTSPTIVPSAGDCWELINALSLAIAGNGHHQPVPTTLSVRLTPWAMGVAKQFWGILWDSRETCFGLTGTQCMWEQLLVELC